MRPLRLAVEGFTAFRDRQEVDFTELDLFVITGPTGAGKTSLLDAMALALYGQVPRMGKHGLSQLVTHGKAEARVLLDFSVDGETYRLSRRLPRKGAQTAKLEQRLGEDWVDIVERSGVTAVNLRAEELVKLDFDSFCKAVVLPQGEFAEFLRGDPGDRRKVLVRLLGLQHYEAMGARARERAQALRIGAERTESILAEQFADATAEHLTAARASAAGLAERETRIAAAVDDARTVDGERRALRALGEQLRAVAQRSEQLSSGALAEQVACRSAENDRTTAETERREAAAALDAATATTTAAMTARDAAIARHGDREQLVRLIDAATVLPNLERRVARARSDLEREQAHRQQAEAAVARATALVAERSAVATVTTQELDERRTSAQAAREARQDADRRLELFADATAAHERAVGELDAREAALAAAEERARAARADHDAAEHRFEDLRRRDVAADVAAGLAPGDTCPVCGHAVSELPHVEAHLREDLDAAKAALVAARAASTEAAAAAAAAQAQRDGARVSLLEAAQSLEVAGDLTALQAEHDAVAAAERQAAEALSAASATAEAAASAVAEARVELRSRQEQLTAVEGRLKLVGSALGEAEEDRRGAERVLVAHFTEGIPADAVDRLERARGEVSAAEASVEGARAAEARMRQRLDAAEARLREATADLAAIDVRLERLRSKGAEILAVAHTVERFEVADLPAPADLRDVRTADLAAWAAALASAATARADDIGVDLADAGRRLLAVAAVHGLDVGDPDAVVGVLEARHRSSTDERIGAEKDAASLETRVRQRAELEQGIAADRDQIAVLSVLGTELRADRFVDFVVQETLDVLAARASEELLRISDGRYALRAAGGAFSVIDRVNAEEVRSVRTLSGGESFMASLSLALALSKHVTELAGEGLGARLEAVFIDEGFGTLDPETLEEVIDALERLRVQDLLVGVISHVPALSDRIRSGLEIAKDGGRSTVRVVTA